jgi:hypothetical protein
MQSAQFGGPRLARRPQHLSALAQIASERADSAYRNSDEVCSCRKEDHMSGAEIKSFRDLEVLREARVGRMLSRLADSLRQKILSDSLYTSS